MKQVKPDWTENESCENSINTFSFERNISIIYVNVNFYTHNRKEKKKKSWFAKCIFFFAKNILH